MKNLDKITYEQAATETQGVYDALKSKVGMVPNLYATVANSHKALTAMLQLGETLGGGEFNSKEVETIALAVGEANSCDYCLSAHTTVGKMVGLTEEQTVAIRKGEVEDDKLRALAQLAREITITRGKPAQEFVDSFFNAGYSKAALAEIIGFVALNTFTNYVNHIADTEIDFPKAKALTQLA
ncbi:MAG: carboxymuconolactone decarboxylase family protein [Bacteroidota bacterium]